MLASASEASGYVSENNWYNELIHIASASLGRTIAPYLTRYSGLALAFGTACDPGFSFNPHDMVCELPTRSIPRPTHPDGHGICPDGKFWFGPKQSCIGGQSFKESEPPAGYYCPSEWHFSPRHSCCVPNSSAATAQHSCRNGNGTWDLIRVACIKRSPTTV